MEKEALNKVLITAVIVLFGLQIFSFYLISSNFDSLSDSLNSSFNSLTEKADSQNKENLAKFESITDSISSLSSYQEDLNKKVSEIKATTSADFSGIIEYATKGVITIKTDVSQGSGFFVTANGFAITNYHVVDGATRAGVLTSDNDFLPVALVGYNENMDIALLKVEGLGFDYLKLGDSNDVKIGEKVIAIGNPLGLSFTVTEGIISAVDRIGENNLPYYFQTDASLNPGNSGGPLIDTSGKVIGINNFKVSGADNIGFALEINQAESTINEISKQILNKTII